MNEARDQFAKKKYWDKRLPELVASIQMMDKTIQSGKIAQDRLIPSKRFTEHKRLQQMICMYSSGEPLESCRSVFITNVHNIVECWGSQESYVELLWYVSLGILFNLPPDDKQLLKQLIPQELQGDMLLSYLATEGQIGNPDTKLFAMRDPYSKLEPLLLKEESNPIEALKNYLGIWYPCHKGMEWFDSHKHGDQFFGYWSFEAAALVKVLKLDDVSLTNASYYPYDLAHFE